MASHTGSRLPKDLIALSAELDALGGGDARVGEAHVCCLVRPAEPHEAPAISAGGDGIVLVRDPRCPADMPAAQAIRRYRTSTGGLVGAVPSDDGSPADLWQQLGAPAFDWWMAGWNATVVAHGETGAGKTHALFGPGGHARGAGERGAYSETATDLGLVLRVLDRFFDKAEASAAAATYADEGADADATPLTLGISYWEVRHTGAVDLLAPGTSTAAAPPPSSDFTTVRVGSRADARRALRLAHSRSVNWSAGLCADGEATPLANRASAFVRLLLHRAGRCAALPMHAHAIRPRDYLRVTRPRDCPCRPRDSQWAYLRASRRRSRRHRAARVHVTDRCLAARLRATLPLTAPALLQSCRVRARTDGGGNRRVRAAQAGPDAPAGSNPSVLNDEVSPV